MMKNNIIETYKDIYDLREDILLRQTPPYDPENYKGSMSSISVYGNYKISLTQNHIDINFWKKTDEFVRGSEGMIVRIETCLDELKQKIHLI